jgi:hypothetical protein
MKKPEYPNVLLIAGTGRKVGKTTLACSIIKKLAAEMELSAIKITPHFHSGTKSLRIVFDSGHFSLYEEMDPFTGKDSSKMLQSGASKVFYIETLDQHLFQAFNELVSLLSMNGPMICESPALIQHIQPGFFIILENRLVKHPKKEIYQYIDQADLVLNYHDHNYDEVATRISFKSNQWKLHK